jgi:hypothetical protein
VRLNEGRSPGPTLGAPRGTGPRQSAKAGPLPGSVGEVARPTPGKGVNSLSAGSGAWHVPRGPSFRHKGEPRSLLTGPRHKEEST